MYSLPSSELSSLNLIGTSFGRIYSALKNDAFVPLFLLFRLFLLFLLFLVMISNRLWSTISSKFNAVRCA